MMIAMAVLMVAVTGLAMAIPLAIGRNYSSRQQSNSTMLVQQTIEKIMAVPAGTTTTSITDCAATAHSMTVTPGGATLLSTGSADFAQTQGGSGAPAGYYMNFTLCSTLGQQATYDVRWNIATAGANKLVTVSAKLTHTTSNAMVFALPVTVRSMIGQGD